MMKTASSLLATAITGLLIGASTGCGSDDSQNQTIPEGISVPAVPAQPSPDTALDVHACKGQNDCAGKGGCTTSDNGCKGKNSCKGKGGCAVKAKD